MQILVVDDDELTRESLEACLTSEGHCVATAESFGSGWKAFIANPNPDLLLTDFSLGDGLDGVDLAVKIIDHQPDVAVLVISGEPVSARKKLQGRFGGAVLPKPFLICDLLAAIGNIRPDPRHRARP